MQPRLPRFQPIEGPLTPTTDAGLTGGWKAIVTPFEVPPAVQPMMGILERVECEIWWMDGGKRRSYSLDAYKTTYLQNEDIAGGVIRQ